MASPTILATGSVTSSNTAGVSKEYVNLETLTFTDPANPSPSSGLWELIDSPPGQTSTIQDPTTTTPTLVLDADFGTFRVRHTADGDVGELLFAVLTTGVITERIPGYLEQNDARAISTEGTWNKASNTQGWFPDFHSLLKTVTSDGSQHGDRELSIPGPLVQTGIPISIPIPLLVGDRILSMVWHATGADTSTKTIAFHRTTLSTGAINTTGLDTWSTNTLASGIVTHDTQSVITNDQSYSASIVNGHADDKFWGIVVTYDRP